MKNFFSAIQGKFDAKYHGRYIGNIIEQIAAVQNKMIEPLLKHAPTKKEWGLKSVEEITTESIYLTDEDRAHDRRADLTMNLKSDISPRKTTDGPPIGCILVEIKVNDNFLTNQLDDYIRWARGRNDNEDRAVVILSAFPITPKERDAIKENKEFITHIYFSDFADALRQRNENSELISLFLDYFDEEGYAMYQLQARSRNNKEADESDYNALLSFMALTFLPHKSGKGKAASAKKIARGPAVFSNIVQNWQLVSDRFAALYLESKNPKSKRRPTIRYFPDQATTSLRENFSEMSDTDILSERRRTRASKICGRYWLTADRVLDSDNNIRLEWGQIIQIQRGSDDDSESIECYLFAYIRKNQLQIGGKIIKIPNGITNRNLYNIEEFLEKILEIARHAESQAKEHAPEINIFEQTI